MFSVLMLTAVGLLVVIFFIIDEGTDHIVKAALRDK